MAVELEDFRSSGRLFHRGTILLKKGTSEIGSSAKVGSVAVGGTEAGQMMGRMVDIIFGV
jgi:hypothetical protein